MGRTAGRYLLGIHWLWTGESDRVTTGELRESLAVSPASVTEMLGRLDERGLVDYEKYDGAKLTPRGETAAVELAWRFCVVTTFFKSVLGTDLDEETAYEIGYVLPEDGMFRLRELTDRPCLDRCPEARGSNGACPV